MIGPQILSHSKDGICHPEQGSAHYTTAQGEARHCLEFITVFAMYCYWNPGDTGSRNTFERAKIARMDYVGPVSFHDACKPEQWELKTSIPAPYFVQLDRRHSSGKVLVERPDHANPMFKPLMTEAIDDL